MYKVYIFINFVLNDLRFKGTLTCIQENGGKDRYNFPTHFTQITKKRKQSNIDEQFPLFNQAFLYLHYKFQIEIKSKTYILRNFFVMWKRIMASYGIQVETRMCYCSRATPELVDACAHGTGHQVNFLCQDLSLITVDYI